MAITSTLTLRLDAEQQAAVEGLQALTGESTASKAILTAVRRYPAELRRAYVLDDELREARDDTQSALAEIVRLKLCLYVVEEAVKEFTGKVQASLPAELDGFEP